MEERGEMSERARYIKAFIKTEIMPYFTQKHGEYSVEDVTYLARLIQAPHDDTHLVAGRYLKPLVNRLKSIWHVDNNVFYASATPEKLDIWLNRIAGAKSFFWADYSSFDATYTAETWDMIETFYKRIYPDAETQFLDVLRIWRNAEGNIRLTHRDEDGQRIWYHAPNVNASGRDDTALANALVNGIVLMIAFACALTGKEVHDLTYADLHDDRFNIGVVGDDSLVGCDFDVSIYLDRITEVCEGFGLVVKSCHSYELADVTFLGNMPYLAGGRFYWGPTLGRRLYKAYWQAEPIGNLPAWTLGVARQMALYQHVPLLSDIAQRVVGLLDGSKVTEVKVDENRPWTVRKSPTPRYDETTLWWLAHRYRDEGLSVGAIRADISEVQLITRLPAVVKFRTTDVALAVDDL